jgi:hypothetical protein
MIEETICAILAELKAIRRILDRDSGADAIPRGFPNGPPPATAAAEMQKVATRSFIAKRAEVLLDARRRSVDPDRSTPPRDESPEAA